MRYRDLLGGGIVAAVVTLLAGPAVGSVINGDFETGDLTGWESLGIVDVIDDGIGVTPAGGTYHALLETNQGGFIGVAQMPASPDDLDTFLGLPLGTLDGLTADAITQGAAMRQTVTLNAGEWITFDWNFLTDESLEADFNDFAAVTLVNAETLALVIADTFHPSLGPSGSVYNSETGYQPFATPAVATGGDYVLGFAILDAEDFSLASGLLVDNVKIVPEPTSLGLLTLLASGMAMRRRRRC